MSNYEKYLKYKNKYLTLKKQLDEQEGGYSNGDYVLFLNSDEIPSFDKSMNFQQLIEHIQKKYFCSMYFKINSSTIYPVNKFESVINKGISAMKSMPSVFGQSNTDNKKKIDPYSYNNKKISICNLDPIKSVTLTNNPVTSIDKLNENLLINIRREILDKYEIYYFQIIIIIRNNNGKFELKKILRVDIKNNNYFITDHYDHI